MTAYKHLIWDWNGTLFDDAWLCVELMNELLARRQLPLLTPSLYETIFDFPVMEYYQKLGFDFAVESFERLSDEFMEGYHRRMHECPLREGAREALEYGRALGMTQSILSAMKQDTLQRLVAQFGLTDYFVDVVGLSDHHAAGKLEVARQWIARQDLRPDEILFIGDTTHDLHVAQALGVTCVHVHSGHHSLDRLIAAGCRPLASLAELYSAL